MELLLRTLFFKKVESLDDIELVVANSLHMGWFKSPVFFCSGSETPRDSIGHFITFESLLSYTFGNIMLDSKSLLVHGPSPHTPFHFTEVYVDDFNDLTNKLQPKLLRHFSRDMLHGTHSIFPPPSVAKHTRPDPITTNKLKKDNGV